MTSIDVLNDGTLGFFWKVTSDRTIDLEGEPQRGYVRTDGGWAVVDMLEENPMASFNQSEDPPLGLIGIMPEDAFLFLELQETRSTLRIGGPRASSRRYIARTAIGATPVKRVQTLSLFELHAHFHGIGQWAGISATREEPETDENGLLRSWSVTLGGGENILQKLPGKRTLALSSTWRVEGAPDKRTLFAPVSIGCQAEEPVELWSLLQPVLLVQDLLNFAFMGFVGAEGGTARLNVAATNKELHDSQPSLWNGALMVRHPGVPTSTSMAQRPLLDLQGIGGIDGLARWIRLCLAYPRATNPVVTQYRLGPTSPAVKLMELAAGFEFWTKTSRPAAWAADKKYAQAISARCGRAFGGWVGDPESWAKGFWDTNNHLKHEPTYVPDPGELADLAESARYLLGAVLLNRAAGTGTPARSIFGHFRLAELGRRLRDRYG